MLLLQKSSLLIFAIAFGTFAIANTEFGIVGILPQIVHHFQISVSQAGMLISTFALTIALFGPFMTLLCSRYDRRKLMVFVLAIFAISNLVCIIAPSYLVLLANRLIPALFHPVYFSVAFSVAASSVPEEQSPKAVAKVFAGVSAGMVLGVPMTSFFANQYSLNTAFLFSAIINVIACIGIFRIAPPMAQQRKLSYLNQLSVFKQPKLWLSVASVSFILSALYAVYSYFSEYLSQVTDMNGNWITAMLILFGVAGVFGSLQTGKMLGKSLTKTMIVYPMSLAITYLLIFVAGKYLFPMIIIVVIWGYVFNSGLITSQTWLSSDSPGTPEFVNSLFVSFANLGVSLGTVSGGWFLSHVGVRQIIWSGIAFLILASISVGLKIMMFGQKPRLYSRL